MNLELRFASAYATYPPTTVTIDPERCVQCNPGLAKSATSEVAKAIEAIPDGIHAWSSNDRRDSSAT